MASIAHSTQLRLLVLVLQKGRLACKWSRHVIACSHFCPWHSPLFLPMADFIRIHLQIYDSSTCSFLELFVLFQLSMKSVLHHQAQLAYVPPLKHQSPPCSFMSLLFFNTHKLNPYWISKLSFPMSPLWITNPPPPIYIANILKP